MCSIYLDGTAEIACISLPKILHCDTLTRNENINKSKVATYTSDKRVYLLQTVLPMYLFAFSSHNSTTDTNISYLIF
jgi:hypothetical protein